ncbi:MAG TPA: hypothetical protein VNW54_08305 [Granulicella sp.]|nr:hypothetical protein [Granulicella sp.]
MLDVHPAHHAASSWKEFLIHIATIVLGLLIAVGLEQIVEYLHHRNELRLAREELRAEVEENRDITTRDIQYIHQVQTELNNDMALLLAHRATNKPLTGKLDFTWSFYKTRDAAWKANQLTGALNLMPHNELERYDFIFSVCQGVMVSADSWNAKLLDAEAIANRSRDGQLSPEDTNELISAISNTQGELTRNGALIGFAQDAMQNREFEK